MVNKDRMIKTCNIKRLPTQYYPTEIMKDSFFENFFFVLASAIMLMEGYVTIAMHGLDVSVILWIITNTKVTENIRDKKIFQLCWGICYFLRGNFESIESKCQSCKPLDKEDEKNKSGGSIKKSHTSVGILKSDLIKNSER